MRAHFAEEQDQLFCEEKFIFETIERFTKEGVEVKKRLWCINPYYVFPSALFVKVERQVLIIETLIFIDIF